MIASTSLPLEHPLFHLSTTLDTLSNTYSEAVDHHLAELAVVVAAAAAAAVVVDAHSHHSSNPPKPN